MAIVGGGGQAELAVVHERMLMPVPENLDWPEAGGAARGVHDRPRRGLHPGRAAARASGCSSTAAPAASAPRRSSSAAPPGARVTATVRNRGAPRRGRGARRRGDRARGLRRARPVRRDPRARRRARTSPTTSNALDIGGRIVVIGIGAGAKAELNLGAADGQARPDPRLDAARAPARGEGADRARRWSARCCRCSPPARCACRSPRRYPLERAPRPTTRFAAGGKLGKIVLAMVS